MASPESPSATTRFWRSGGVRLTVGFLDGPAPALIDRVLMHMNAWSRTADVAFVAGRDEPQIRVARAVEAGNWSYIGTDMLLVDRDWPTMNLAGLTMSTSELDVCRVVRHQTGHALGCAHERLPRAVVDGIDAEKAVAFYGATQGWSPAEVRRQILTPIEDGALTPFGRAGQGTIMGHQLPAAVMRDGRPALGPSDVSPGDLDAMGRLYPGHGSRASSAAADQCARSPARSALSALHRRG